MSSVQRVPDLTATHPQVGGRTVWVAVRQTGPAAVLRAVLHRFRYGDGFSHSRALGFQLALAALPLLIAAVALAGAFEAVPVRRVVMRTVLELTPGASDPLIRRTVPSPDDGATLGPLALVLALSSAVIALTTAMAQVERGANRLYGIQRDRPTAPKYARALLLAVAAGLPVLAGSAVLVAGGAFAEAVESVGGLDSDVVAALTWPAGAALLVGALAATMRWCPARRQPSRALLFTGTAVAFGAWVALTFVLAGFLQLSAGIGSVYGPLTAVIALLLWVQLTSAALFLGLAVSAELELVTRAHVLRTDPVPAPEVVGTPSPRDTVG